LKKSNPQNRNLQKSSKFQLKQATCKLSRKTATPPKNKLKFAGKPQGWHLATLEWKELLMR